MANTHSLDLERSSSQYAYITDANQSGLDISGTITIEAWIKLESLPGTGNNYVIAGKTDLNSQRAYQLYVAGDGLSGRHNVFRLWWSSNGTGSDWIETTTELDSSFIGVWHHIAGYANPSTGTGGFYLDGSPYSSTSTGGTETSIYNSTANFAIGAIFNSGSPLNFFDGLIDEVRVWNDIRTQTEISDNYKKELNGSEDNLVGYWKLNNNYLDETANNNNLTASGSPTFSSLVPFGKTYYGLEGTSLIYDSNLKGYWKFDETSGTSLADYKGLNNLTANNSSIVGATGKFGKAITTTTSYYAEKTSPTSDLEPASGTPWSVSFWLKTTDTSNSAITWIAVHHTNTVDAGWWIRYNPTASFTYFYGKGGTGNNRAVSITGNVIRDGTWHNYVITWTSIDGNMTIELYRDGVDIGGGSDSTSGVISYGSPMAFSVGKGANTTIDDLAVFNRVLTPSEALEIANSPTRSALGTIII